MDSTDWDLIALVRDAFQKQGVTIRGTLEISLRYMDEGHGRIRLDSLKRFASLFGDGIYYIDCVDVNINTPDGDSFGISYMQIQAEYNNGKWKPRLYTDEEVIFEEDIGKLEARRTQLTLQVIPALQRLESLSKG